MSSAWGPFDRIWKKNGGTGRLKALKVAKRRNMNKREREIAVIWIRVQKIAGKVSNGDQQAVLCKRVLQRYSKARVSVKIYSYDFGCYPKMNW